MNIKKQLQFYLATIILLTSCNNAEQNSINNPKKSKLPIATEDDSSTFETWNLCYLSKSNPKLKKIYNALSDLDCVKSTLRDSSKYYDTILLETINVRTINDSTIRFPKDCLKVDLTGHYNKESTLSFFTFTYIMKNDSIIIKDWSEVRRNLTKHGMQK